MFFCRVGLLMHFTGFCFKLLLSFLQKEVDIEFFLGVGHEIMLTFLLLPSLLVTAVLLAR